jgi:thiol-disulfide isomerase/thioredoxin
MKHTLRFLAIALIGVSASATAALKSSKDKAPALNGSLSDVTFGTPVNNSLKKEDLAGKVVVVEEWGTHCPPCLASLPHLAKMAKAYEKKGLVVLGLEKQGSTKEAILGVIKNAKVGYPIMAGGSAPGGTGTIPHVCIFDRDGKFIWNGNPADKEFENAVKKALQAKS